MAVVSNELQEEREKETAELKDRGDPLYLSSHQLRVPKTTKNNRPHGGMIMSMTVQAAASSDPGLDGALFDCDT